MNLPEGKPGPARGAPSPGGSRSLANPQFCDADAQGVGEVWPGRGLSSPREVREGLLGGGGGIPIPAEKRKGEEGPGRCPRVPAFAHQGRARDPAATSNCKSFEV